MRILLALLISAAALGPASAAEVRNFFTPMLDGSRVDACLASGACGKAAADAFCKAEGYDHAMIFQREPIASSRALDSGKTCSGSCTAFKQVKCFTTKNDLAAL